MCFLNVINKQGSSLRVGIAGFDDGEQKGLFTYAIVYP